MLGPVPGPVSVLAPVRFDQYSHQRAEAVEALELANRVHWPDRFQLELEEVVVEVEFEVELEPDQGARDVPTAFALAFVADY